MDIVTYALCKKIAQGAVSGISNLEVNGTDLIITQNNGTQTTMTFPTPADGISVTSLKIENKHLICTLSDGSTIDAGEIPSSSSSANYTIATQEDIDKLFEEDPSEYEIASESDIDNLFKEEGI